MPSRRTTVLMCCVLLAIAAHAQGVQMTREQRFRSESALVLINASVVDRTGRPVTDLAADRFQVDRDEYCLITFSDTVDTGCELARDPDEVLRRAFSGTPSGETAFYDAGIAAIGNARAPSNARRAVLILSDGRDTARRFGWKEAIERAKESTACLYALAPSAQDEDEIVDEQRLKQLVGTTGGRVFEVRRSADYPSVMDAVDIRRQYMIGYSLPAEGLADRWRRVKIKLKPAQNSRELRVFWRQGYYPPTQENPQ